MGPMALETYKPLNHTWGIQLDNLCEDVGMMKNTSPSKVDGLEQN